MLLSSLLDNVMQSESNLINVLIKMGKGFKEAKYGLIVTREGVGNITYMLSLAL